MNKKLYIVFTRLIRGLGGGHIYALNKMKYLEQTGYDTLCLHPNDTRGEFVIKDLEKYIDYEFSSGCYTGEDYKSFQTKYINFLRSMCKQNHWQLVNVGRNHYCFSAFIKSAENKCVYVSISDVRFFTNEWYNNILIRTAKNEQDYYGGFNHRTTLKELEMKAMELLEDFPF